MESRSSVGRDSVEPSAAATSPNGSTESRPTNAANSARNYSVCPELSAESDAVRGAR